MRICLFLEDRENILSQKRPVVVSQLLLHELDAETVVSPPGELRLNGSALAA